MTRAVAALAAAGVMTPAARRKRELLDRLEVIQRERQRRRSADPLAVVRWLPGQHEFLSATERRFLFRAGNQSQGKTWAGAAELIWRCLGRHPYKVVRKPPIRAWVVCGGAEQAGIVQQKIWELIPQDELEPGSGYDDSKGAFTGKYPSIRFKNGSRVQVKTGQQDALNLASGTLDYIWIDEPPESERVYHELQKRLMKRRGDLAMTLTPVNRPVAWLKKMCEEGKIRDIHRRLEARNMIPVGDVEPMKLADGTPCDQAWIDSILAESHEAEIPVVVHGEWEFRALEAYFAKSWNPATMIRDASGRTGAAHIVLGIDWGDAPGKQMLVLALVYEQPSEHPMVFVLDELDDPDGIETPEVTADRLVEMLARHGLTWADLDFVGADREHMPRTARSRGASSLALALQRKLRLRSVRDLKPPISTVKRGPGRGAGSATKRAKWLHYQMIRGKFAAHPRCVRVIEAIPLFKLGEDDGMKDPLDAVFYGLDPWTFAPIEPDGSPAPVRLF